MDLSTDNDVDGDNERLVEGIHGEAIEATPGEIMSKPPNCFIALSICSCKRVQVYGINRARALHFKLFDVWVFSFVCGCVSILGGFTL